MIPSFDVGDKIRLGNATGDNADDSTRDAFRDIAAVATDPTTVTLRVLKPDATTLVYSYPLKGSNDDLLIKESAQTGRFYFDLTLDLAGDWVWQLSGTGAVETSESGQFHVRWSPFA